MVLLEDCTYNALGVQNDPNTVPELGGDNPSGGFVFLYLLHSLSARQHCAGRLDVFPLLFVPPPLSHRKHL